MVFGPPEAQGLDCPGKLSANYEAMPLARDLPFVDLLLAGIGAGRQFGGVVSLSPSRKMRRGASGIRRLRPHNQCIGPVKLCALDGAIHFPVLLLTAARPIRPEPNSSIVAGSGTGAET